MSRDVHDILRHEENCSRNIFQLEKATTSTTYLFEGVINGILPGDRLETTKCFPTFPEIKFISRRSTSSYIREIRYPQITEKFRREESRDNIILIFSAYENLLQTITWHQNGPLG
ncbi:hypothetical protein H5410_014213 [Solanum commersonii]|uniref:Uncharacterized protein n=1 Tax=Solanum commersonii TaxID=4109 RepID=A0A9J5ZQA4_SOLCO|nr:hypothetical protein H5410_014213 [Solanum commersonii]